MFQKYKKNFIKTVSSERYAKLINLYSKINFLTYKWMAENNVYILNLPITTQSVTSPMGLGSDSKPYKVISKSNPLFEFYLADSMQFHLELLLRAKGIKKVGYITNTFRGENVDERHLHQFNHFEIEMKGNLKKCKKEIIDYIFYVIKNLLSDNPKLLNYFNKNNNKRLNSFLNKKIKNLNFQQAIEILSTQYLSGIDKIIISNSGDFEYSINSVGEKFLIQKFDNYILWLNNFPTKIVPFYQANDGKTAINADLFIGIGETVGCGQRCDSFEDTLKSIRIHENDSSNYQWYLEMKNQFPMKTSGFGLGLERFVLFLIGEEDIRNVQLIPRETDKEILP